MRSDVYIEEVLSKCKVFQDLNHWPATDRLRAEAWMTNFTGRDRYLAARLLDNFVFFNTAAIDKMLVSAVASLVEDESLQSASRPHDLERKLHNDAQITFTEGEEPNPSDSGYTFARKARQVLRFEESRIVFPNVALVNAESGRTTIFVDDIVGSGNQFIESWNREHADSTGGKRSFASVAATSMFYSAYVCLVVTRKGLERLKRECPDTVFSACHIVEDDDTVFELGESPSEQSEIEGFLLRNALKLTLNGSHMQSQQARAFGFQRLGLLIGFENSIPDATLPIFWYRGPNWQHLIERN